MIRLKTGLSRTFAVGFAMGRIIVFCVGLTALLVLGFGVAATVLAAEPGDPLRLGKTNAINRLTRLVDNRASPLLQVKNDGGPALNLVVPDGTAPLVVSSGAGQVFNLDADLFDGQESIDFMPGTLFRNESAVGNGTELNDGTRYIDVSCPTASRLLSGGPANIDFGTIVLESYPTSTQVWRTRIQNDDTLDAFSTVVLCARF